MSASISASELAARLRDLNPPKLLDVRNPDEHAIAAIAGSRLIPLGELFGRVHELADWRDEEIVVFCHHGMRSQQAIGFLKQAGFDKLTNLTGGIDAWSVSVDDSVARY